MQITKLQLKLIRNAQEVHNEKIKSEKRKQLYLLEREKQLSKKRDAIKNTKKLPKSKFLKYLNKELIFSTKNIKNVTNYKTNQTKNTQSNQKKIKESDDDNISISESEYFDTYQSYKRPPRQIQPNIWASIYKKDAEKMMKEKKVKRKLRVQNIKEFRSFLQQQINQKENEREKARKDDYLFACEQNNQLKKWKEKEKYEEKLKTEKNTEEALRFRKLLAEKRNQRELHKKMKIKSEMKEVMRIKDLINDEKDRIEKMKILEAKRHKKVAEENIKLLQLKKIQKEKILQEEQLFNRQYIAKLKRQDEARKKELEETYKLQEMRVNLALLNVKSDSEIAKEDEERARRVQERLNQEEKLKIERNERNRKQRIQEQIIGLEMQKEYQKKMRIEKKNEDNRQAILWKKDCINAQKEEELKIKLRLENNVKHRKELEKQMKKDQINRINKDMYGMDALEMKMNQKIIREFDIKMPVDGNP